MGHIQLDDTKTKKGNACTTVHHGLMNSVDEDIEVERATNTKHQDSDLHKIITEGPGPIDFPYRLRKSNGNGFAKMLDMVSTHQFAETPSIRAASVCWQET